MPTAATFAPPPTALGQRKKSDITWKDFLFPQSVAEFRISEDAKVATYAYAGRNGAEHERVLSYRVIVLSGSFTAMSGTQTPYFYIQKLRSLNDNKPGVLQHSLFGRFTCIMKSLTITDAAANQEVVGKEVQSTYNWTAEFWEHTDPSQVTLGSTLASLFPAADVRPPNDNYSTKLIWKTTQRLFEAIKAGKIEPGTDPIKNSDWLSYPLEQRTAAYSVWTSFLATGVDPYAPKTISQAAASRYKVPPGGTAMKAAADTGIALPELHAQNQGEKVRNYSVPGDGFYWKTPMKLQAGDVIKSSAAGSTTVR